MPTYTLSQFLQLSTKIPFTYRIHLPLPHFELTRQKHSFTYSALAVITQQL